MGPSFKFGFPLSSRKNSDDSQWSQGHETYESRLFNPGTKAEKVLGPSEPHVAESKNRSSRKEKKLQKYSSFTSATFSEGDGSKHRNCDERLGYQSETIRHQPSSPLLGHQYTNDAADWDNRTDISGVQAHRSRSSSTLRSYYDSSKSPLYISQQTSASSARDMALRKGYSRITPPQSQDIPEPVVTPGMVDECDVAGAPKSKPLQLDMSALFPKPNTSNHTVLSPNKVVRSPSQISLASSNPQSVPTRPRWFSWDRKMSKESISSSMAARQRLPSVDEGTQTASKIAPKSLKRASQTWYEGIEEDEGAFQDALPDAQLEYEPEKHRSSLKVERDGSSRNQHIAKIKSNQSRNSSPHHQNPIESIFSRRDRSQSRQSSFTNCTRGTSSNGSQKSVRWEKDDRITVLAENLQNQSFLLLSSSDDEDDERALNYAKHRRRRIRESIETTDTGDEVLVCSAERVKTFKPRPIVNIPKRKTSKNMGAEMIPPVPSIPIMPQLGPRVSSMRWKEDIKVLPERIETTPCPDHSRGSSTVSRSASQLSFTGSQNKARVRGIKMMSVTSDEEKLLEAMRRKRASLRQGFLTESGDLLLRQPSTSPRPRTADGEGEARSSYFEPNELVFPQPLTHGHVRFLHGTSYAASVDDISRVESFPSYESSTGPRESEHIKYTSKPAPPSLSFTPSDIVVSTPTSYTSPLTPPPDHESLSMYETGIAVAHPPPELYPSKHYRKRTLSSGVVVLDGAEQSARQLDEENEIAGWAMDRW